MCFLTCRSCRSCPWTRRLPPFGRYGLASPRPTSSVSNWFNVGISWRLVPSGIVQAYPKFEAGILIASQSIRFVSVSVAMFVCSGICDLASGLGAKLPGRTTWRSGASRRRVWLVHAQSIVGMVGGSMTTWMDFLFFSNWVRYASCYIVFELTMTVSSPHS